jgi:hypothetical protein
MPSPSADRSRKAVKLSQPLHRDLAAYAFAASAAGVSLLALALPAEAQIIYTPTHELLTKDGHLSIDLNNDGVVDVTIREVPTYRSSIRDNSLGAHPQRGGGLVMGNASNHAKAMRSGSIIGGRDVFLSGAGVMYQISTSGNYYLGSWSFQRQHYLGIRFLIGSEVHYGWARMETSYDERHHAIAVLLSGYAYETQPNAPIRAGDTGQDAGQSDEDGMAPASSPARPKAGGTLGALALGASAHP